MSESETREDTRLIAGRYKLTSELGRGGMGTVWRADDTLTGRTVAVKELRPQRGSTDEDRQDHLRRSLQEARSAARISHPNAVTLYDVIPASTADEAVYLIMELVNGPTLHDLVYHRGGTLPSSLVAKFGLQLLDVLEVAHGLGIVHRDIKPGNVLVARGDQAKLTDFGIAHLVGGTRLTRSGTAGTLAYMAPELFQSEPISEANDIWSLGVTLFYAADGRVPFERDNDAATMRSILDDEVPVPGCEPGLAAAIGGMLRHDTGQRFTIEQAREALNAAAQGLPTPAPAVPATPPPAPPSPPSPPSPSPPQPSPFDATTGGPKASWPPPSPEAQPSTGQPVQQRPSKVGWNEKASTGLWKGTPTSVPKPQPEAPAPPRASRFSRKTLLIGAAVAVVAVVAGAAGAVIATSSGGGPLSLRATKANPGHAPVGEMTFSSSGSTMITTADANPAMNSQNGAIAWDAATATTISPSYLYSGLSRAITLSPDGGTLAIAGDRLYVYNVASHSPLVYMPFISPQSVAFGHDASTLAVGGHWNDSSTEAVKMLNPATRQWTTTMPGLTANSNISGMEFSPDGSTLAATDSTGGSLYLWDVGSRSLITPPVPLTQVAGPLAFSPDGKTIAVAEGGAGQVRLWNVAGKSWGATLTDPQGKRVNAVAYSPDGKTLAVADGNGDVDLWNTTSNALTGTQNVNSTGVTALAFSPDGKTLATGDHAGVVDLWTVSGH